MYVYAKVHIEDEWCKRPLSLWRLQMEFHVRVVERPMREAFIVVTTHQLCKACIEKQNKHIRTHIQTTKVHFIHL